MLRWVGPGQMKEGPHQAAYRDATDRPIPIGGADLLMAHEFPGIRAHRNRPVDIIQHKILHVLRSDAAVLSDNSLDKRRHKLVWRSWACPTR